MATAWRSWLAAALLIVAELCLAVDNGIAASAPGLVSPALLQRRGLSPSSSLSSVDTSAPEEHHALGLQTFSTQSQLPLLGTASSQALWSSRSRLGGAAAGSTSELVGQHATRQQVRAQNPRLLPGDAEKLGREHESVDRWAPLRVPQDRPLSAAMLRHAGPSTSTSSHSTAGKPRIPGYMATGAPQLLRAPSPSRFGQSLGPAHSGSSSSSSMSSLFDRLIDAQPGPETSRKAPLERKIGSLAMTDRTTSMPHISHEATRSSQCVRGTSPA